jgi:hypothetical protein
MHDYHGKSGTQQQDFYISKLDFDLRKKLVQWLHLVHSFETWTPRRVDQKCLESFEVWCWSRMEKIIWTDRVSNEELLHRGTEERKILPTIHRTKANCISWTLRRNCLIKHATGVDIERRIEVTRRRGRRRKYLLDEVKERRKYWKLEHSLGTNYGPVVRQTTEWWM